MVTLAELKRNKDTILAVWPIYDPVAEMWWMHEIIENEDHEIEWREHYYPLADGHIKAEGYPDKAAAIQSANEKNLVFTEKLLSSDRDPILKQSLQLKTRKSLQSKERLQNEEALMLSEAIKKHANDERVLIEELKIATESEQYRNALFEQLNAMPYLKLVRLGKSATNHHGNCVLYKNMDGSWSRPYFVGKKGVISSERAKIAQGFGFSEHDHWGRTKVKIRQILLPRANQLLQQASVQRLLAEALAKGDRVLVSNGVVFWYEPDGNIGWQVKTTYSNKASENSAIWIEGKIHSTNHGRLVILPYIKDNGEQVQGHTKNAPHEGPAKPRHPDHYVDIPFKLYDGDLMIGLLGELPYE